MMLELSFLSEYRNLNPYLLTENSILNYLKSTFEIMLCLNSLDKQEYQAEFVVGSLQYKGLQNPQ